MLLEIYLLKGLFVQLFYADVKQFLITATLCQVHEDKNAILSDILSYVFFHGGQQ